MRIAFISLPVAGAGLKVDWKNPYSTISKLAWLTQTPKEFDFDSSDWPPQFHHAGRFLDRAAAKQCHCGQERAATRTSEASVGLHHACRVQHGH
jgi:hypothetical protein